MDTFHLTKFDVAERQLNQAIHLFFDGGDPVSVHTLAEAASQVLYDIRKEIGAVSKLRDSDRIRPEYKREWLAALARSRNFFKHADKDADVVHEFKDEFNHFSIMDGVNMLLSAKNSWTPETIVFFTWFATRHPGSIIRGNEFSALFDQYRVGLEGGDEEHRRLCVRAMRELRSFRKLAGLTNALGTP